MKKKSDQNYSELYFELNDTPAQLENFISNYDLDNQENIIDFETTVDDEKRCQIFYFQIL